MKTISAGSQLSASSRTIAITGVIPDPPERKRYFFASGRMNWPNGPLALIVEPASQIVVQPVRDLAAGDALDRDRERVVPPGRGGDAVASAFGLSGDVQIEQEILTRLEIEALPFGRGEGEGLHVMRFLVDVDADEVLVRDRGPTSRRAEGVAPWRKGS